MSGGCLSALLLSNPLIVENVQKMSNCPNGQMGLWLTLQPPSLKSAVWVWASLNQSHCTVHIALYTLYTLYRIHCTVCVSLFESESLYTKSIEPYQLHWNTQHTMLYCLYHCMWGLNITHCIVKLFMWGLHTPQWGLGQIGAGFPASEEEHSHWFAPDATWKYKGFVVLEKISVTTATCKNTIYTSCCPPHSPFQTYHVSCI